MDQKQVGEILRTAREKKKISLEQIEKITHVRKKHLESVERNEWAIFSSKAYVLGIVRAYGGYLNLDIAKLEAFFRRDYERKDVARFNRQTSPKQYAPLSRRILFVIGGIIAGLFLLYFGYQIRLYTRPPRLDILSPKITVIDRVGSFMLVGKVEEDSTIRVNGHEVIPDDQHIFRVKIPLLKSAETVKIEVIGANGRKTILEKVYTKGK